MTKLSAELRVAKSNQKVSKKKLEFIKNATEQILVDSIISDGYKGADNIIIGAYSATLDEDEIEIDEAGTGSPRSRKDIFLSMKSKLNLENEEQSYRFNEVKNLVEIKS